MNTLSESLALAAGLVTHFDAHLVDIVTLSLRVSLTATFFSACFGLPMGAAIAVGRFSGRSSLIVVLNALMGLPPVVVGLVVYLMLSRAGPLGELGLLFTPGAMIIAQTILITPIIAALTRQIVADAWAEYREQLTSLGAGTGRAAMTLLWDTRFSLATVLLAGFGRAIAEVGAVMIVGGNIDGVTRVMTTTIALETSKGDLPLALALGLVLIAIVVLLNAAAQMTRNGRRLALAEFATGLPIRLRRVAAAPGGAPVLSDIDIAIEAGGRTVLLGPNGAGKSTLLRVLHGLIPPTAGSIAWGESDSRPRGQAMVFQRPVLLRRSAADNVRYALDLAGVHGAEADARIVEALDEVGLRALAARPARVLSGGEQQKLAFARVWALRPEVLFLDEPTASLDPAAARSVEQIVADIHARGTTIVMTTHNLVQAKRLADDILFLHAGRVTERTPAAEFFAAPRSVEGAQFLEGERL